MKRQYDLIIFDWDGTLVDSIDWIVHCIQQSAIDCCYPVPEEDEIKDIIGLSIEHALLKLFPDVDRETQQMFISKYTQYFRSKQPSPDDLFTGVKEMLLEFKQLGYKLAVATGKKNEGLQKAMHGTGIGDLFCITRSADQTASKPDPLMLEEIVNEMQVSKQRTLMVGDSEHDMQMARNAGIFAVAVECGAHDKEVLSRFEPLHCLPQTCALSSVI